MKVSVIILNWNGKHLLEQFLPQVVSHTQGEEVEVVVADNGSSDNSVEFVSQTYPSVRLIAFSENYGFAEGYNRAIEIVDSEYVVLLNSDVETTDGWLQPLVEFLDRHPNYVAVQPKIRAFKQKDSFEYAGACGGYIDYLGYPFCRGRIFDTVEKDSGQYDDSISVFWATGACLCIRRNVYLEVGGLDAVFFAHMEEIDLCWRLHARGYNIACLPQSVVYHVGGASLNQSSPRKTFLNFRNNLIMLYKNLPQPSFRRLYVWRSVLDMVALLLYVAKFKWSHAKAIWSAHVAFHQTKKRFSTKRLQNQQASTSDSIPSIYTKSIVWLYYAKNKKHFTDLPDLFDVKR